MVKTYVLTRMQINIWFFILLTFPLVYLVSTKYPPMQGGVGCYPFNLTKERKIGFEVLLCHRVGDGEFSDLSPDNPENSSVVLELVEKRNWI
jgi:hypothetical protein